MLVKSVPIGRIAGLALENAALIRRVRDLEADNAALKAALG